jgi:hypothetical protein
MDQEAADEFIGGTVVETFNQNDLFWLLTNKNYQFVFFYHIIVNKILF